MLLILTAWHFRWASAAPGGGLHLQGSYIAFNRRPCHPRLRRGRHFM